MVTPITSIHACTSERRRIVQVPKLNLTVLKVVSDVRHAFLIAHLNISKNVEQIKFWIIIQCFVIEENSRLVGFITVIQRCVCFYFILCKPNTVQSIVLFMVFVGSASQTIDTKLILLLKY